MALRPAYRRGCGGYGQSIDGDLIDHEGQILKFPFGTERRDYEFWDIALREAALAVFDEEDEIDGMTVCRFVQTIKPTVVSQLEVPGSLAGSDEPAVEADMTYANTRTLWVEPGPASSSGARRSRTQSWSSRDRRSRRSPAASM